MTEHRGAEPEQSEQHLNRAAALMICIGDEVREISSEHQNNPAASIAKYICKYTLVSFWSPRHREVLEARRTNVERYRHKDP
jgi:hypothetical protein